MTNSNNETFFYTYFKRFGNQIFFKYNKNGEKYVKKIRGYEPKLYIKNNQNSNCDTVSIFDEPLLMKQFDSMKDATNFANNYSDAGGKLYGNKLYDNQFVIDLFEGQSPEFDPESIDIGYFDIETDYDDFPDTQNPIYQIQQIDIKRSTNNVHYSFGLKDYVHNKKDEKMGHCVVEHMTFDSEEELLKAFVLHMEGVLYELITGWNSEKFDVPYLINRIRRVLGEAWTNRLSPFGKITEREVKNDYGNTYIKYDIIGLPHMDYMEVYKKHTYTPRESYKLDYIALCELGEGKDDFSDVAGTLKELWEVDPNRYIYYNIKDVDLLHRLDQKLGLFSLIFVVSYTTFSNYEDLLGTTRLWQQFIAKHLYNKDVAPLFEQIDSQIRDFEGAYVHPVQPGFHDWVVSFDLDSLYPHLIQQVNIGPETIVPYNQLPDELKEIADQNNLVQKLLEGKIDTNKAKKHNLSMAANGCFYRKDKASFLSELMHSTYATRKQYKKQMKAAKQAFKDGDASQEKNITYFDNMQMGMKIILNSLYGVLGNRHFLYFLVDTAESVTTTGQLVNKWCSYQMNDYLNDLFKTEGVNYLIAGDTDSFYIMVKPIAKKLMRKNDGDIDKTVSDIDKFCVSLNKKLEQYCDDLSEYLNSYVQAMNWSREVIAKEVVWVAKKKYVMKVMDDEGLRVTDDPKYKIMGTESVKSSTPQWAKTMLIDCYKTALNEDESAIHKKVSKFEKKFYTYNLEEIAIPSGVNNIGKYQDDKLIYTKGTPKHVKGVLVHNWLVDQKGLKHVEKITKDGSKIKYLSLRKPNPINQDVVAFDGTFPKEFGLDEYVDRKELFNKGFIEPLKLFLNVIGWTPEEINTLI